MILQVISKTASGERQEILTDNLSRVSIFSDAVSFLQNGTLKEVELDEGVNAAYLLNDEGQKLRWLKAYRQKIAETRFLVSS